MIDNNLTHRELFGEKIFHKELELELLREKMFYVYLTLDEANYLLNDEEKDFLKRYMIEIGKEVGEPKYGINSKAARRLENCSTALSFS